MSMSASALRLAWPALLALTLAACGGGDGGAPRPLALEGGKFVNRDVPAFAEASYRSSAGGTYYDDGGGESARSQSWFFETQEPYAEVVAFYEKALPQAEKIVDGDQTVFTWRPEGGREGDEISIFVSEGEIQICESVDTRP
jgi:hypothetical protein